MIEKENHDFCAQTCAKFFHGRKPSNKCALVPAACGHFGVFAGQAVKTGGECVTSETFGVPNFRPNFCSPARLRLGYCRKAKIYAYGSFGTFGTSKIFSGSGGRQLSVRFASDAFDTFCGASCGCGILPGGVDFVRRPGCGLG
jgi:hypothetical protein